MANPQAGDGIDALDYAIIRALSADAELTNKALARQLDIAESTCAYRIRRLRETGVIGARRLEIDYAKLGGGMRAVVIANLYRHTREAVDDFMDYIQRQPNVINAMNVTGRFDFIITVAVSDVDELRGFVLDHVTNVPQIRSTETLIVFDSRNGEWLPIELAS